MIKWIKKMIRILLIKLNRCPYCRNKFESAFIWDATEFRPSLICPYRHFINMQKIRYTETKAIISSFDIDVGGAIIPIPEELISYDYGEEK